MLYVAERTRPDIAFAVNNVSRYNLRHSLVHWQAVKRIFRYLKGTMNLKLRYHGSGFTELHGFTDADWATDVNERKLVSGYLLKMCGAAISWSSKKQPIVALSSTEAEYIALSSLVCEALWLRQLAGEIDGDTSKTITLFCDNESSIKLAKSDAYRPRTKHIDTRYHHVRQYVENKTFDIKHISTKLMTADSLTKGVSKEKHEYCAKQAGLV